MQQTNNLFRVLKPKPQWITTIGKPILDGGPCRRIRAYNFSSYTSEFANKKNKTQVADHRQGKFKPSQNKKPIWKQGDPKEKRKFDISKIKCFNCNQYGHFAKVCLNKKDQQICA